MSKKEKWYDKFPGDFLVGILLFVGILGVAALVGLLIGDFFKG